MNNNKNDIRLDKATRSGKFHHRACLLKKGPFIFVCTFWTISKGATLCYWFRQFKNVVHWHVAICIAQRRLRVQVRSISCTCPRGSAGLIQVMPHAGSALASTFNEQAGTISQSSGQIEWSRSCSTTLLALTESHVNVRCKWATNFSVPALQIIHKRKRKRGLR